MSTDSIWSRRNISRRTALRSLGLGVAGLAGAALIGCGDEDEAPRATATAAATSAPASAATSAPAPASSVQTGGTFTRERTGDAPTIDPYGNHSFLTKYVAVHAYSRLYQKVAEAGVPGAATLPGPDLAESTETADGLEFVVKLKPGAKFQNVAPVNGREVTTEDVLFSWARLIAPESTNAPLVAHISGLEAIDDRTLKFTHNAVNAVFLDNLADANLLWVMPTESDGGFNPELEMIGSGPWINTEFTPDVTMRYDRNPDWHLGPDRPYLDELIEPVIPEYANQLAQFQAGNLDQVGIQSDDVLGLKGEAGYSHWQWIAGDPGSTLNMMHYDHLFALQGEAQTDQPWKDARVRQATSMALDRAAKLDFEYNVIALKAAGLSPSEGWHNHIPVGQARWWLDPRSAAQGDSAKYFEYNVAEAKKLLAAAGFADGFDVPFIYSTNRYGSRFGDVQEVNLAYLQAIGIRPQTQIQDYGSEYSPTTRQGKFNGLMSGWNTPFPEAGSYSLVNFDPENPRNTARVDRPDMWEKAQKQLSITDNEERREALFELQRMNAEEMYYIPMTYGGGSAFTAAQPWMKNIGVYRTQGYGFFSEMYTHYWIDQNIKAEYS